MHQAELSKEERCLYTKMLSLSQKALKENINQQEPQNKDEDRKVTCKKYLFSTHLLNINFFCNFKGNKVNKITEQTIILMILRLRQVCTHPDLVFTMFENDDSQTTGRDTEATQNACSILFLYSNDAYFKRRATLFSIEIRSAQR
jgi:SNF2 family DNA or RNA helicase